MKILVYDTQMERQFVHQKLGKAELYPDSSVIITRKPLFIPDWCDSYVSAVAVAARVCRLGKNIAERFALRYWREVTACFVTRGNDNERHDALSRGFDGAIALGDWVTADRESQAATPFTVSNNDTRICGYDLNGAVWELIDKAIVEASRYMTIKMGDIIAVTTGDITPIAIGDTLLGTINEQEVLKTKIK